MEAPRLGQPAEPGQEAVSRSAHGARGTSMLGLQATAPLPALPANRRGETTTPIPVQFLPQDEHRTRSPTSRTDPRTQAKAPLPTPGRLLSGDAPEHEGQRATLALPEAEPLGTVPTASPRPAPTETGAEGRVTPTAPSTLLGRSHSSHPQAACSLALWSPPGMKGRPASQQKPVRHRRPRFKPLNFGVVHSEATSN